MLRVAPPDGLRQLFYEFRMMRREPAIRARLLAETQVPVPRIIHQDFSRTWVDRDWMVLERLRGSSLSGVRGRLGGTALEASLREWGAMVARVHALTAEDGPYGYRGEPGCMPPQPTWAEAFRVMYRRLLDDIVDCRVYHRAQADAAQGLLEEHIDSLQDGAYPRPPRPALLHGDLWVTNLLVDPDGHVTGRAGAVTGLLDFDRACWGDVEWDLAIAEYCGVTRDAFWQGYGRRIEPTPHAAVRRLFYLLYEHQRYIVIRMSARHTDPAGARRYADECLVAMERFRRTGEPVF